MSLRCKTQLFLGIILLSVLLILDITFSNFLIRSAEQTDRERMTRDLSRAAVTIRGEERTLSAIAGNWAYSDKAWEYMQGLNPDYPNIYLNRAVLTEIGISSMIFLDNDFEVKYFRDFSAPDDVSTPESELVAILASRGTEIFSSLPDEGTSGIVMKGEEPIFFSIKHIRRSDKGGYRAGYLIVTMAFSPKMIQQITRNLHFTFSVEAVPQGVSVNDLPSTVIDSDPEDSYITGRILIKDYTGGAAFWVSGIAPKVDIRDTDRKLQQLFLFLAFVCIIIVLIFGVFFKHQLSDRIKKLQHEIEAIRDESGEARHITIDRKKDEISSIQRTLNDFMAFFSFKQGEKSKADDITISVYRRFAETGDRLCMKTLEDIATSFTPGDEKFRSALPRAARAAQSFAKALGVEEEELLYIYTGALFSRIGMLSLPIALRGKSAPLSAAEQHEYNKYPIKSKDFMEAVELLRPASQLTYSWNENWDGGGFPQGLSGSSIPYAARIFAVADAWNELTRPWPGRRIPSAAEAAEKLRAMAGSRLDPQLVEKFLEFLKKENLQ
ncbi:MAG: CHASE4 domain-containing protein [Synergistaceae bacterium]|nr:CHASE4 domain-containing protein [Synergistaceae bacterium]